jgi:glycerol dehydrogenase
VGLPTTFTDIGLGNPGPELLEAVAERASAPGETIHNEPMPITSKLVVEAMRAADSAGTLYRGA